MNKMKGFLFHDSQLYVVYLNKSSSFVCLFSPISLPLSPSLSIHPCFQLNPSKLEKNEDVNLNLAHLLNILSELVEKIFMAAEILPP